MAPVTVRGLRMEVHPGDYLTGVVEATGDFYEADILDELARRLQEREPGAIVDAGAMIGNHSLYLAAFAPHTMIHAFEPIPGNVRLLRQNVKPFPSVVVWDCALSARVDRLPMRITLDNLGHSHVYEAGAPDLYVPALALDDFTLGGGPLSLLKLDVEGHEPKVLAGARHTIARDRPLILIEDWRYEYGDLLPGYRLAAEWGTAHQTYLYEWPR